MANPTITFVADSAGLTFNNPSLFDLRITASSDPTDYALGRVDGWCVDISTDLPVRATYTGVIYSSYEYNILIANPHFATLGDAHAPVLPSVPTDNTYAGHPYIANFDLINWLINNIQVSGSTYIAHVEMSNAANQFQDVVVPYYTLTGHPGDLFTYGDVQQAMYELLGDGLLAGSNYLGPYSISNVTTIVNEADTHDGFVPHAGEKLAVVVDAGTNLAGTIDRQPLIITTQAAALGDYVWNDANHNGIQDAGETGINGATVDLVRDLNNDHIIEANEILATTTTADNPHVAGQHGYYEFDGLTPGLDYQVQFVMPAGYDSVSPPHAGGNPAADSDALVSNVVVLAPGQFNSTIDAGFYQSVSVQPAALGDFVWSDTNANGIQDAGEAGISGVTVNLLDSTGTNVLGTTTTDANGLYHFTNLNPGSYEVQFVAPAGYTVSPQDQGANDDVDSDADTVTGKTITYTLVSGQTDNTIDAGLYQKAALGDFVWADTNANGIQDAGEAGISGVTVNLLDSTGANVLGTTTTDANGLYHFTNLKPGSYEVQFVAPAGYSISAKDQGANNAVDSDADTVTGKTIAYTLVSGQTDNTIDAGLYQKAALGDFVWADTNANGIQDAGEAGIANVTVNLLDSTGTNVLGTTTTDANGLYHFTNLNPGSYEVQFVAPAGYTVSPRDQGADDAVDSDANAATGKTIAYTLTSGQTNNTVDAGVYQKAALGDFVWADTNANGIQDAGEAGIANVTVNLLDSTGANVLGTTTTDANGLYHFTNLNPGSYEVQFVAPAGYTVSPQDQGADDTVDSDANAATGKTIAYTLVSGQTNNTIDAGLYQKAALGDFVWADTNANGIQDAGEAGISGVTVNLLDSTGANVLGTTTTDANGLYHFTNLNPGSYEVQFVAPAGYTVSPQDQGANDAVDSDADTSTGKTQAVTLVSGQTDNTIDAGLYQKAALGDFVWSDTNANGIQDAGEAGISGVTVNLLDSTGANVLGTTTTDANGLYHFTNLNPGSYEVQFVAPAGYTVSPQDQGADDTVDSDANAATGKTIAYTLVSGQTNNTVDAGLYQKAAIGDFVWNDTNANGVQDAGENGISGVTVKLLDSTGANVLGTTTTDANGLYHFTNLNPGSYEVQFVAPAGYTVSPQDQGADDAVDSDANAATGKTIAYTLISGQTDNTIDAGLYQKAALGDFVWSDTNANGIQDAGEAGISGVTVNLLDSTGANVLGTTTTDANGLYHFTNLNPGSYEVQFVAPAGYTVSPQDQGADDAVDSDANAATGKTIAYTLISGQTNNTVDAGLYQKAALGDFVWADTNANGIQDAGEAGISGVTVNLLDSTGANVLGTTTTDANGLYHFTNLNPGSYEVQFVAPAGYTVSPQDQGADDAVDSDANAATGKTIAYTLTSGQTNNTIDAGLYQKAALGDFVWSDTNANGIQDAGEAGISGVTVNLLDSTGANVLGTTTTDANGLYHFTNLNPGSYEVQFVAPAGYSISAKDQGANDAVDSDADTSTGKTIAYTLISGQTNNTVDAGLYQKAALGDFVWADTNANGIQDAGEAGISGVTVNLLDSTGANVLGTTTTDANGLYHFTNLNPGSYEVQFVAPAGYSISAKDQSANDAVDSDADTSTGKTIAYTLISGQTNNTVDAGLYQKAALGDFVWSDTNANGIQDAGEAGISGVTVNLLDSTGANVLGTTTTDANGLYHFTNLNPGSYEVQFVAPAGYSISAKDQGANDAVDSDADTVTGKTIAYTLTSGQTNNTVDAGVYQKAALGDFVWADTNANGIQDAGEAGISGVTVNLLDSTGANVLGTTTTDANGLYHFTNLNPGSYEVQFVAPAGYSISAKDQGANDAVDSDADTVTGKTIAYTLTSGQTNNTVDAGLYQKAALGDFVWAETNANGIQDAGEAGISDVTVNLLDSTGANVLGTTTTDANGLYHFTNLNPGSYEVQFVAPAGYNISAKDQGANDAVDSDADTSTGKTIAYTLASGQTNNTVDAGLYQTAAIGDFVFSDNNANGIQDAGEAGIAGVTVKLLDSTGTNVLGTTTTDANGLYHFTGLTPGSYEVQFVAPAGYSISAKDQGANDAADSDADTVTGKTIAYTLTSGQTNNTVDAGLYQKAALGDFVWNDANANGIQDAGETGISGVTVKLLDSTGTNVLGTTTTDANGLYHFTNLTPGSYEVQFVAPAGYSISPKDQGANDATDSDADTSTGKTIAYTLTSGQTNNTVDAGLYHTPTVTPDVFDGTIGFWKTHPEAWNGSTADNSVVSKLVKSGVLTKADVLPTGVDSNGDGKINSSDIGVLIGDANGNGKTDAGETTLFIPLAAAQLFIDPSASGNDPRAILLRQAIAAQLNIDNGHGEPNDLVGEAAAWLRGMAPFTYSDGSSGKIDTNGNKVLDAAEFTISNGNISFTSAAQNSSKQLWMQDVDVYGGAVGDWDNNPNLVGNQEANGEDLKNALQSFNMGQLVTSTNGSFVGLSDGTSLSFAHANTTDSFWLTLHDGGLI